MADPQKNKQTVLAYYNLAFNDRSPAEMVDKYGASHNWAITTPAQASNIAPSEPRRPRISPHPKALQRKGEYENSRQFLHVPGGMFSVGHLVHFCVGYLAHAQCT